MDAREKSAAFPYYKPETPAIANITENSITLKWEYPEESTASIEFFEIKYKICGQKRWNTKETKGLDTGYTVEPLNANTEYEFKIRAIFGNDQERESLPTDPVRTKFPALSEPTLHYATEKNIHLKWFPIDGGNMRVERYVLHRREVGTGDWININIEANNATYSDAELIEDTEYEYYVSVSTVDGLQTCSSIVRFKTRLPAPSKLCATTTNSRSVILEFHLPTKYLNKIKQYRVEYKIESHEDWVSVPYDPGSSSKVNVNGLQGETTYVFRIRAIYSDGYSDFSQNSEPVTTKRARPTQPVEHKTFSHKIMIEWEGPEDLETPVTCYDVAYKRSTESNDCWRRETTIDARLCHTVENLLSGTTYLFCVRAVFGKDRSEGSQISKPISTNQSIASALLFLYSFEIPDDKHRRESNVPVKYRLPLKENHMKKEARTRQCTLDMYTCTSEVELFERQLSIRNKTILLVGQTGSGKTELVDLMANYLLDVDYDDPFRFSIVKLQQEEQRKAFDQSVSQTEWITEYRIPCVEGGKVGFNVNVIDTPGFGDTRGIKRDQEITQQISSFFKDKDCISGINAVGIVVPSFQVRLTPSQKYIIDSILSIFGADFRRNIFIFVTFADLGYPPVFSALIKDDIPYEDTYKFNNDVLRSKNTDSEAKWKMGTDDMKRLFSRLEKTKMVNLRQTGQVLEKRHELEATVQGLQPRISEGLNTFEILCQEISVLELHKVDIESNRNFEYKIDVVMKRKVKITDGSCTNCNVCEMTCHVPCIRTPNSFNRFCYVMKNGKCTICKCSSSTHEMGYHKYEVNLIQKTRTYKDLKKKYLKAEEQAKSTTKLILRVKEDIRKVWREIIQMVNRVCMLIQSLQEIALKPCPLANAEYIKILMETEKYEAKRGSEERLALLKTLMDQAELIQSCSNSNVQGCEDIDVDALLIAFEKNKKCGVVQTLKKMFKTAIHSK